MQALKSITIALVVILILTLAFPQTSWADASPQNDRTLLTLDLLQERLKSPNQSDGSRTVDLRQFIIDLRPENAAFRDQFYRLIQTQLQRSSLGIDFSYSLIRGELKFSELGLRIPLYGTVPPLFNQAEQNQFERDRRRLSQLGQLSRSLLVQTQTEPSQITVIQGPLNLVQTRFEGFVNFSNTFFLSRVEAQGARFEQDAAWSGTRFSRVVSFAGARFQKEARFRSAIFFNRVRYSQTEFRGFANFQGCEFRADANFNQTVFEQSANLSRIQWQDDVDFSRSRWQERVVFDRSKFLQSLFLTEAIFEKVASFRQVQFSRSVNLRGASIVEQTDFADASFAPKAYLNVANLQFDPRHATILGDPDRIGRVFSVPTLEGNEIVLRNLVQNFRDLQQISDANDVEYSTQLLRSRELRQRIFGINVNIATLQQLQLIGFSAKQAETIIQARSQQPIRSFSELLNLGNIDFSTYVKVHDRVVLGEPISAVGWVVPLLRWVGLSLLLLLTQYGTNFWLVLGVGMIAIAHFGVMFWFVDRFRRLRPKPIVPNPTETAWVMGGFSLLTLMGILLIFRNADRPWLTLTCLETIIIPIPAFLLGIIYWKGRYHDLLNTSYFVEDGTLRQLRFLIGRLPIIPAYPLFRERYSIILWDKRWSWLNYFDLSLNNLLKFGFNDIRLRDEHVPGLITILVWYQWGIGSLYFAFLLWTLSRTIPGLNLLIYFK